MRLQIPQLPAADPKDKFGGDLVFKVKKILTDIVNQVNGVTDGSVSAAQSANTAAPVSGTFQRGDAVRNSAPAELGTADAKYVITGWVCVAAGTPGTWVACRSLTGN